MATASKTKLDLATLRTVPSSVWALGFVALLMDISSEMIHALLPVYMITVLGASTLTVGFIEGIAEATGAFVKVFSGALSDRLGRRKMLTVGALWDTVGPSGTFFAGAAFATLALLGLVAVRTQSALPGIQASNMKPIDRSKL
jgi:MFS family permease